MARARRSTPKPKVHTVDAASDFLDAVAKKVTVQKSRHSFRLADTLILVPNRQMARELKNALSRILGDRAAVMPRIDTPDGFDDEHLSLKIAAHPVLAAALADIPPAVSHLERQIFLAEEILKMPGMVAGFSKAMKLAAELGHFMDMVERHQVDLKTIGGAVPPAYQGQWHKTETFLKIVTEAWPQKLQQLGRMDPAARRNAILQIQAAHWLQAKPRHPVLAVGFDEDTPAMRTFLSAILSLPKGGIVIDGLDLALDQKSWDALTPVHPQFHLKKLLAGLGIDRAAVEKITEPEEKQDEAAARQALLREALRPAATADAWGSLIMGAGQKKPPSLKPRKGRKAPPAAEAATAGLAAGLRGLDLLVAGTPQEEASVIALKMRESLEQEGRTVALVTADRSLARRVSARLRYWRIDVEDEAGMPLSMTPVGVYLLSAASAAVENLAPAPLLSMLKHPLTALSENKKEFSRKVSLLEDRVLRGARPAPGVEGAKGALSAAFNRAAKRGGDSSALAEEQAVLAGLLVKLEGAGKEFFDKMSSAAPQPFGDLLTAHLAFAEALAADDKTPGAGKIWRGEDGVRMARFLSSVRNIASSLPSMTGAAYLETLQGLLAEQSVTLSRTRHPTLRILTPEQARWVKSDVMILGGMNADIWPRKGKENPWLPPDMAVTLGFPPAEETAGLDAHIFAEIMSNKEVLVTRSLRSGNAPAVASSLLTRLLMVVRALGIKGQFDGDIPLLEVHTAMHTPPVVEPVVPPAPAPALAHRPKTLPVTAIEMLMRDPYSVYARYVLRLRPKEKIDAAPSPAERGMFTHEALDTFLKKYPDALPPNAEEALLKTGADVFAKRINSPSVHAFWWPRFERIAKWFVAFEKDRRQACKNLGSEVKGKLEIDLGGEVFTLTTIADRVDLGGGDQLEVIDYKTGSLPSQKDVALGVSPQLTLEALISFSGGFDGIAARDVGTLQYWKLSGGRPAADVVTIKGDVQALVREAQSGVQNLMKAFNDPATPYLPLPRPDLAPRYEQSRHLSRIDEWNRVKKEERKRKAVAKKPSKKKTALKK